ncbi:MAG: hypothetical protein E6R05_06215 [Candidatus Moraniibacteriota bacterium]|nr:MAG: hypothetical protein E6R05_06215 [Candidatus Moranbacteria bacterium]
MLILLGVLVDHVLRFRHDDGNACRYTLARRKQLEATLVLPNERASTLRESNSSHLRTPRKEGWGYSLS